MLLVCEMGRVVSFSFSIHLLNLSNSTINIRLGANSLPHEWLARVHFQWEHCMTLALALALSLLSAVCSASVRRDFLIVAVCCGVSLK